MTDTSFDWPNLMRLGLQHLQLSPQEFWGLTPYELMLKSGAHHDQAQSLGRTGLDALLQKFPDKN